jgi:hypothetical protein
MGDKLINAKDERPARVAKDVFKDELYQPSKDLIALGKRFDEF